MAGLSQHILVKIWEFEWSILGYTGRVLTPRYRGNSDVQQSSFDQVLLAIVFEIRLYHL